MKVIFQLEEVGPVGSVLAQLFLVSVLCFPLFLFTAFSGIVPLKSFLKSHGPECPVPPNQKLSLTIMKHRALAPIYFNRVGLCHLLSSKDLYFPTTEESPSPGDFTGSNRQVQSGKMPMESLGREVASLRVPCVLLSEHLSCQGLMRRCPQTLLPSRRALAPLRCFVRVMVGEVMQTPS